MDLLKNEAFQEGLWGGVFEVIALGIVAFWVNVVYQKIQRRKQQRRELIHDLDAFSSALYPPRKLYQALLDRPEILEHITDERERTLYKMNLLNEYLADLTRCAGQFRALQIQIVPLFGYHVELFAYYMAIWRYLRQLRKRMERKESLYFHHETPDSSDAFYRLIDQFRYQIQITPSIHQRPSLLSPPSELRLKMQSKADDLYQAYFENQSNSSHSPSPVSSASLPSEPLSEEIDSEES